MLLLLSWTAVQGSDDSLVGGVSQIVFTGYRKCNLPSPHSTIL